MKTFCYLLFFLLFSTALPAQSASLTGVVTDEETNEPLLFADVVLYRNGVLVAGTQTDFEGLYHFANLDPGTYDLQVSYLGYETQLITDVQIFADKAIRLDVESYQEGMTLMRATVTAYRVPIIEQDHSTQAGTITSQGVNDLPTRKINGYPGMTLDGIKGSRRDHSNTSSEPPPADNSEYGNRVENDFLLTEQEAFSTFGIDVDRATYGIVRSHLNRKRMPPAAAVRTEEMINYFAYDYPRPEGEVPFRVTSELAACPWAPDHWLLAVGLQGAEKTPDELPPSNLTFLLDVSGSMDVQNKLPLVKSSLVYLVEQLRPEDKVSIVVYAGAAGVVLPPTPVADRAKILNALDSLRSGGSTAGGQGIRLAYRLAREQCLPQQNNRVILATDGDFNIGIRDPDELEKLIELEKESGIYLTVLGFGMGNLKDNLLERLADKGNGMYAYIDTQEEAQKVFGRELTGSLYTIAKDVKLQLEFDPAQIAEYRLLGYENRLLNKEDFDDDRKDAGELGAGHSVTAFYELVPHQASGSATTIGALNLRYKLPDAWRSNQVTHELTRELLPLEATSDNFRWAAAVAAYSLLLQRSSYRGAADYDLVNRLGESAIGEDPYGLRRAFLEQVVRTKKLATAKPWMD